MIRANLNVRDGDTKRRIDELAQVIFGGDLSNLAASAIQQEGADRFETIVA